MLVCGTLVRGSRSNLTFIKLVCKRSVDLGEGFGEVGRWGLGGGECVLAGLDGDGAVAPR